jgi:hypothetical protein
VEQLEAFTAAYRKSLSHSSTEKSTQKKTAQGIFLSKNFQQRKSQLE